MPRISIAIPTYNGAKYIEDALNCLQRQTCTDFDVVISDNGSTDGTSEICARFASTDSRFIHSRIETTIPVAQNFIRARDLTTAPYFMWLSDDDVVSPNYLERLADALDRTPHGVLAVGQVRTVGRSKLYEVLYYAPTLPADRIERIGVVMEACRSSWFYGLWRREAAVRHWNYVTERLTHIWAADHLTMLAAILDDGVVSVPDVEFTQHIARVPDYVPGGLRAIDIRNTYKSIVWEMVRARSFSADELKRLEPLLEQDIDRRVASWRWIIRRFLGHEVKNAARALIRGGASSRPSSAA